MAVRGRYCCQAHYRASDPAPDLTCEKHEGPCCHWKPAIHMPRWASRLTLLVTATKIERLQDISYADAIAEGVEWESADPPFYYVPGIMPHSLTAVGVEEPGGRHAERCYAKLWNHLHGPGSWEANPEVVAITFKPVLQNIDRMEGAA
jgi:hypothetical protein